MVKLLNPCNSVYSAIQQVLNSVENTHSQGKLQHHTHYKKYFNAVDLNDRFWY